MTSSFGTELTGGSRAVRICAIHSASDSKWRNAAEADMKILIVVAFALAALAVPATAHPHGAKSKRHHGKAYRPQHRKRAHRRYRRAPRYLEDTCSVQPSPHFQDYPYWAACAFTPKSIR